MSQELYYTRVATVRETQQFQRDFGPIIAQVLNSAPVEVVTGCLLYTSPSPRD